MKMGGLHAPEAKPPPCGIIFAWGGARHVFQAKYSPEVAVAPDYDFSSPSSMLSLLSARSRAEGRETGNDGPARFGEGPTRVVDGPACPVRSLQTVLAVDRELAALVDGQELEEAQDEMEERALDALYALLDQAGVSRDERLVIVLREDGKVEVDEHPQRDRVQALLAANPELTGSLRDMAALALAARGMNDISRAGRLLRGQGESGGRVFQTCLKGGLAHCHLVRG